jgi:hypothetical protein
MFYFNGLKVIQGEILTQMLLMFSVKYEFYQSKVTLLVGLVE